MDLSWLARGTGVPQLDDPVDLYTKQMNLAQIARAAQMQQMQMKKTQEADDDSTALRGVLGELHAGGYSDQAIQQAIGKAPRASGAILQAATAARKAQGDYQNDVAKTQETRTKTAAQQLEILGGAAGAVVQNPTRQGLMAAQSLLAQNGIDPSALNPPEGADFVQHFSLLRDASLKAKEQAEIRDRGLSRDVTMRGQDLTADTAAAGHGVTARGQDIGAATARAGHGVTIRGQDLVNARSIDSTAATREATAGGRLNTETQALAKFIDGNALPNLITSANALDQTLRQYSGKDIPGVGATGLLPPLLTSPEGKLVRSKVQGVSNDLLKLYSGGAVTLNEAERRAVEMMASGTFTDEDLRGAWPLVKGRIDAAVQNVKGGFSPQSIQTYEGRGGIPLRPIGSQDNKAIGGPSYGGKGVKVQMPNGKTYMFPDEATAAKARQDAGL